MNAYRTLREERSKKLEDESEDWDPSTDDEKIPDEDVEWNVSFPFKLRSPDIGSIGARA